MSSVSASNISHHQLQYALVTGAYIYIYTYVDIGICMVLGQLPPQKIALQPKTNTKPNPKPNQGEFSSGAIAWLPSNPKTNPDLDIRPNAK